MHKQLTVCQSCGKPINENNLGQEADGSFSASFCSVCYEDGQFTQDISLQVMQEIVKGSLDGKPIPKFVKKRIVANIQNLKRWSGRGALDEG